MILRRLEVNIKNSYLIFDVESTTHEKGNPYSKYNSLVYCGFKSSVHGYCRMYREFDRDTIIRLIQEHEFLVTFNGKFDLGWLLRIDIPPETWYNIKLWDVQLYHFLHTNQKNPYPSLNGVAEFYGGPQKFDHIYENYWSKGIDTLDIPKDELIPYADQDLDVTEFCFLKQFAERMNSPNKFKLFRVQQEDQKVLLEMEYNGMLLDVKKCVEFDKETQNKIQEIEEQITNLCPYIKGIPFNFDSNDHKSALIYGGSIKDSMQVAVGVFKTGARAGQVKYKKTEFHHDLPRLVDPLPKSELAKEGYYATNDKALNSLKPKGPAKKVIQLILSRQKLQKLSGTYFQGFPNILERIGWEDNLIHSTLNQCKVATGRLSSDKPNTQNIPPDMKPCFITRF